MGMIDSPLLLNRRDLLSGLGGALISPLLSSASAARPRAALALEATAGALALGPGLPPTPVWRLGGPDAGPLRFRRGETIDVSLANHLPVPVSLNWIGLDGAAISEPLTGQPPLAAGGSAQFTIALRHAGTILCSMIPLGASPAPLLARAVLVRESETLAVDVDEVLLIEDRQIRPDSGADAASGSRDGASAQFAVNGAMTQDISASQNQRLRLRFINGSQRSVIAIRIADHEVRVMAIDGQPAEPFPARDGLLVLAPGSRVDAFVDAVRPPGSTSEITLIDGQRARPIGRLRVSDAPPARAAPLPVPPQLPSNGLPARLDLKAALRVDLRLNAPGATDWLPPQALSAAVAPAFKVRQGRTVVLALANGGPKPVVFHLHGHHFRLLDRLDDGWKPFWLDTLAINPGQTQRIAFAAEFPGLYPLQATPTDLALSQLFRSYLVE